MYYFERQVARRVNKLPLLEIEDYSSDEERMLTVLVDGNLLAVEVLHIAQGLEIGMRMTTEHEIDASRVGHVFR